MIKEARRHWLSPAVTALFLSIALIGIAIDALATRLTLTALPKWGGEIHLIWLALAADVFALRRWQEARRMFQDAQQGEVEIRVVETEEEGADTGWRETLPLSSRRWTEAGKPAAWRRMRS
jgi:hypothetical protein